TYTPGSSSNVFLSDYLCCHDPFGVPVRPPNCGIANAEQQTQCSGGSSGGDPGDNSSPIVLSLENKIDDDIDSFPLSGPSDPVLFDMQGTGHPRLIRWTKKNAKVGFLVLDRNGDGRITSGKEMFGNFPPLAHGEALLPPPPGSNGY